MSENRQLDNMIQRLTHYEYEDDVQRDVNRVEGVLIELLEYLKEREI